jgi:hypothetical protein
MKKLLFILAFTIFITSANACEICGCGVSNFYMGTLPHFKKGFIGARYHYTTYHTVMASDATQYSYDYFKSTELWGGINIGKKWQLLGFVPYNFNKQNMDDGTVSNSGLGDITLLVNYKLLGSFSSKKNKFFEQSLFVGGGIKLPTGKFEADLSDPAMVAASTINTQIGSGSTDFLLNGMYNAKWNKFGINSAATYKINTTNSATVKYGNKAIISATAFYNIGADKFVVSPTAGLLYENLAANFHNNEAVESTGGNALMATTGLQIQLNKISVGAVFNIPLSQNFSDNQTKIQSKGTLQFTFAL